MVVKRFFPSYKLIGIDYLIGGIFLAFCSVMFFHEDIGIVGADSLNYLFGSPIDFYDNCKEVFGNISVGYRANYSATIYAVFALWLYPFKLFSLLKNSVDFPLYLVYWLKSLATIVYVFSGVVFYKITRFYFDDKDLCKYATAIWLATPIAIFSQFIFSQVDIFYVFLTLVGFLMFLRKNLFAASLVFGVAITFKYFPVFVFIPLLLLFEKRIPRLIIFLFLFLVPTLLIQGVYGQSAAFVEGVNNFYAIDRIYAAAIGVGGGWKIYCLIASFTFLCGAAYLFEISKERLLRVAAYVFLVASILPFLFVLWHPNWLMFCFPAIVLTTMMDKRCDRFLVLDLVGMVFFVGVVTIFFQNNVDLQMFRGGWLLGLDLENVYKMSGFFKLFKEHSANVFLSAFWAYLVVQIVLKFKSVVQENYILKKNYINYSNVRVRFYIGILIFIIPACIVIYRNYINSNNFIVSEPMQAQGRMHYGPLLKGRIFEQTFIAKTNILEAVDLKLVTLDPKNSVVVFLEIVDSNSIVHAKINGDVESLRDDSWQKFEFDSVPVVKGDKYKIRLTSHSARGENAVVWWSSPKDSYSSGNAIVDGVSKQTDFSFMVTFS